MNEMTMEQIIADALIEQDEIISTQTFEASGVLTTNNGLVVRTQDGSEFQITIVQSRYRSLIPSLALLIHVAEMKTSSIDIGALEKAIKWGDYLATHAHRIYASACGTADTPENLLASKIENGHVADRFTILDNLIWNLKPKTKKPDVAHKYHYEMISQLKSNGS